MRGVVSGARHGQAVGDRATRHGYWVVADQADVGQGVAVAPDVARDDGVFVGRTDDDRDRAHDNRCLGDLEGEPVGQQSPSSLAVSHPELEDIERGWTIYRHRERSR